MWTGSTFTNLNSMHGDSGQLSLILIQYTVTLVSGSLLIIEKMKVLIIFVTLVYFAVRSVTILSVTMQPAQEKRSAFMGPKMCRLNVGCETLQQIQLLNNYL